MFLSVRVSKQETLLLWPSKLLKKSQENLGPISTHLDIFVSHFWDTRGEYQGKGGPCECIARSRQCWKGRLGYSGRNARVL